MSMDMEVRKHDVGHEMHMAHRDMNHVAEVPCERCEDHVREQAAVQRASSVNDAPLNAVAVAFNGSYVILHTASAMPRPHLTAAGPPVVPGIIRTVVLRT